MDSTLSRTTVTLADIDLVGYDREIQYPGAGLGQKVGLAAALGVVAQHGHCLALVKVGVAGGAVAYAAAQQLVLTGERFAHHDAARQND